MIRVVRTRSREDEWEIDDGGLQPLPPWDTWSARLPLSGSYFRVYRPVCPLVASTVLSHSATTDLPDDGLEGHSRGTLREEASARFEIRV